jgi:hypothetical protein
MPGFDDEWDPDALAEGLQMDRNAFYGNSSGYNAAAPGEVAKGGNPDEMHAKDILRQSLPMVASSVVHLAVHSTSERTRLDAAKIVFDRTFGPVNQTNSTSVEDPLDEMLKQLSKGTGK